MDANFIFEFNLIQICQAFPFSSLQEHSFCLKYDTSVCVRTDVCACCMNRLKITKTMYMQDINSHSAGVTYLFNHLRSREER